MAEKTKVIADRSDIVAIADAVRRKTDTTEEMTLWEIASNIRNIGLGGYLFTIINNTDKDFQVHYTGIDYQYKNITVEANSNYTFAIVKNSLCLITTQYVSSSITATNNIDSTSYVIMHGLTTYNNNYNFVIRATQDVEYTFQYSTSAEPE